MGKRKPLIAGNWKMNLDLGESEQLVRGIAEAIRNWEAGEVLVAPPFTALGAVKAAIGAARILLAAQNMHWERSGAYTGEISGRMLREAGCTHVILGHSERRTLFHETSAVVNRKVQAAGEAGLTPIVCVGETIEQREAGATFRILEQQLDESLRTFKDSGRMPPSTILAYEPVWAIGTGHTASREQAQEVHRFIRDWIAGHFSAEAAESVRILYGGSVKPENIRELMGMPDLDGALVGGASLKADSFAGIIRFDRG